MKEQLLEIIGNRETTTEAEAIELTKQGEALKPAKKDLWAVIWELDNLCHEKDQQIDKAKRTVRVLTNKLKAK